MATGMVLVIVMRHIDLSVGSIIGFVSTIIGVAQVHILPVYLGLDNPAIWIIAVVIALAHRRGDRRLSRLARRLCRHSRLHRHPRRPIVLARRGVVGDDRPDDRAARRALRADGRRPARLDRRDGELGARRARLRGHRLRPLRRAAEAGALPLPAAADVGGISRSASSAVWSSLGATAIVNAYPWPERVAATLRRRPTTSPCRKAGLFISTGYAIPVLIALVIGVVMTFLARRTRFGRYVYATGGNPEAAELAGINTKTITVLVFALMGMLAGGRGLHRFGAARFGDQRARPVRRALCDRRGGDRRHVARRRRRHDLRRDDRRAGHPVAAVGHGAARLRLRPSSRWWSAWCWSARSASTPSIAAEPPRDKTMDAQARTPLVEMKDISLAFGGLKAVDDASIDLYPGEVVGLLGHNGAGKSCLIKVLSRRLQARRRAHLHQRPGSARSTIRATPSITASRRSTRRWRSPTTSTRRRTSISAASC